MKVNKWVVISSSGKAWMTVNRPKLSTNEIAIYLTIDLPDALFKKPKLVAEIKVPDEAAQQEVINSLVSDNVSEAVNQATGLEFNISIQSSEDGGGDCA